MASIFNKNTRAPFDDICLSSDSSKENSGHSIRIGRVGLSFREAVFIVCSISTLAWIFAYCSNIIVSLLFYVSYLFLWAVSLRFIENKKTVAVNPLLNMIPIIVPCAIWHRFFDPMLFYAMIPVALGVTVLGSIPADGRQNHEKCSIANYLRDVLISIICISVPDVLFRFIGNKMITPRIIMASLMMILIVIVADKIFNYGNLLSGNSLSGSVSLPKSHYSTLTAFISGRLKFAGVSLVSLAAAMGLAILSSMYTDLNPVCVRALATTVVFSIWTAVRKHSKLPFEAFIAILLFSRSDTLVTYLLAVALDILLKGYLTVTRRKSVFHERNKYVDGIPVLLVTISVFIMVVECCI